MKKINLILLSLAALFFAACTDDAVDDLKGIYDMDIYNFTEGTTGETETSGSVYLLYVTLTDDDHNTAAITFGSSAYNLPAATYSSTSSIDASKQYIGTLNGSAFSGDIDVTMVDSIYYFNALLTNASNETFKMTYKGVLTFEEPEVEPVVGPTELTNLLSATSNVANGTNSVTLNLATSDVTSSYDASTWSYVYSGTGYYLAVDFYSEDGYLAAGTYTAGDASSLSSGQFAAGYDPGDIYGWGISFTNWGTCWWTVEDGTTSAEHITDGTITVSISGGVYTITLESSTANAVYTGEIAALYSGEDGGSGSGSSTELTNLLSATSNVANGTNSVTLNLATSDVTSSYDASTWSYVYSGTGYYLAVDFYSEDGYLRPGTYTVGDASALASGQFAAGYDPGDIYGWGFEFTNWGTCWWTVEDGATSAEHITDGTIYVSISGGVYTITLESSVANAEYTGRIDDLYSGEDGDSGRDTGSGSESSVELTNAFCVCNNNTYGSGTSINIQICDSNLSPEYDWTYYYWAISGTGNYMSIDIYTTSTDLALPTGTFTAAESTSATDGNFIAGYTYDYWGYTLNGGSLWYTVTDGTASAEFITDGTVTITDNSDGTYTIALESSVANATYTGAISFLY